MKKQYGFTVVEMMVAILLLAGTGGWVANIVKLAGSSFDQLT